MTLKRLMQFMALCIVLTLPLMIYAQDADPTPAPDAEATAEATAMPEITMEATVDEQNSCPEIVERAIQLTQTGCEGVGNNDVCYGNLLLDAVLRGSSAQDRFDEPGDVIDVIEVENLSLSALDIASGIWGVVLLQIDAAFEQVNDDQVTYVVFGDAELQSANQLVLVTTTEDSAIRQSPAADADTLTDVSAETRIVTSGITEDGAWLRIRLPGEAEDDEPITGWLDATLVEILETNEREFTFADLPVVTEADESDTVEFGPMQAFYFESGRNDAPCEEAPESGVLIQTPEGQASVSVWIDEVVVELSATAFVQANAGGDITINVLDGAARVTANGETRDVTEGNAVSVPLDENLGADGVPSEPVPIDPADLNGLPVVLLPEQVDLPGTPTIGDWTWTWGADTLICNDPDSTPITFQSTGTPGELTIAADGSSLTYGGAQYARADTGVYTNAYIDGNGNLHQDTLTVVADDLITGLKIVDYAAITCTLEVPFTISLAG